MLRIHFLNVGHGDCTIIRHPSGNITMIDINNGGVLDALSERELFDAYRLESRRLLRRMQRYREPWSYLAPYRPAPDLLTELTEAGYNVRLTDPIEFLERTYPGEPIYRYIQTHPDMDHMTGLAALVRRIKILNFWNVANAKEPEHASESRRADWEAYQAILRGETSITILYPTAGDDGYAWNLNEDGSRGGDGIEILSPTLPLIARCNDACDWNSLSFVLRVAYGEEAVLLPGDAEEPAWTDIVSRYGARLRSTVLKASHHGRDSGYSLAAVRAIQPDLTIVSVGKKPDTDASNKYRRFSGSVLSTRFSGSITVEVPPYGRARYEAERR